MYTDIGSGVYGYRVRIIQIQGQMYTDIGSDVAVQVDSIKPRVESAPGFRARN